MKKIFKWLIDKWLAGFITASIFFILKFYIDLPANSKTHFFSFNWLSEIFELKISLLTFSIIVLIIILITRIEKWILKSKDKKEDYSFLKVPKNQFENYKMDLFGIYKTNWTWNYEWRAYEQKFAITDLKPSCPNCGTPTEISRFDSSSAECHKCRLEGRNYYFQLKENFYDIEKEIIRRITNNEFKINCL